MSLDNIFKRPKHVDLIGKIYPIEMKNWDTFEGCLNVLMTGKQHLPMENNEDTPLLHRLILVGQLDHSYINNLITVFNLITKTNSFDLRVTNNGFYFHNNKNQIVNIENYEDIRKIVLHQNLLIEPKVFKNKLVAEWADKVLKEKQRKSANVNIEEMITTVAALSSKDYEKIETFSIYQLKSEFYRWQHIKNFDAVANAYGNPYAASDLELPHFAEFLDLYADPYKDVFKSDKGMNITQAFK